jgi:hypothetical protein
MPRSGVLRAHVYAHLLNDFLSVSLYPSRASNHNFSLVSERWPAVETVLRVGNETRAPEAHSIWCRKRTGCENRLRKTIGNGSEANKWQRGVALLYGYVITARNRVRTTSKVYRRRPTESVSLAFTTRHNAVVHAPSAASLSLRSATRRAPRVVDSANKHPEMSRCRRELCYLGDCASRTGVRQTSTILNPPRFTTASGASREMKLEQSFIHKVLFFFRI